MDEPHTPRRWGPMPPLHTWLTSEQMAAVDSIQRKWLAVAFSCEPSDFDRAEHAVAGCYRAAGAQPPERCIIVGDPVATVVEARKRAPHGTLDIVHARLRAIRDTPAADCVARLQAHVSGGVNYALETVTEKLDVTVRARFGSIAWSVQEGCPPPSMEAADRLMEDIFKLGITSGSYLQLGYPCVGNLAWVDCLAAVAGLPVPEGVLAQMGLAESCGSWLPLEGVAILQDRPYELHVDADGRPHRDGGPAVSYRSGCRMWVLNGVHVPQWLVETRGESIDPKLMLEIDNGEIRREFVHKVGIDRICESLNAQCVDRQGSYELLILDPGDGGARLYLKMLNPSIGTWHIEGVHPDCRTVAEAMVWRNRTDEPPEIMT